MQILINFKIFLENLDHKVDIIILTEIWTKNISFMANLLGGYTFFHKFPIIKAGGVGIYIRNELTPNLNTILNNCLTSTNFEFLWIDFVFCNKTFSVCGVYRHNYSSVIDFCDEFQAFLHTYQEHVVVQYLVISTSTPCFIIQIPK